MPGFANIKNAKYMRPVCIIYFSQREVITLIIGSLLVAFRARFTLPFSQISEHGNLASLCMHFRIYNEKNKALKYKYTKKEEKQPLHAKVMRV